MLPLDHLSVGRGLHKHVQDKGKKVQMGHVGLKSAHGWGQQPCSWDHRAPAPLQPESLGPASGRAASWPPRPTAPSMQGSNGSKGPGSSRAQPSCNTHSRPPAGLLSLTELLCRAFLLSFTGGRVKLFFRGETIFTGSRVPSS